MSFLSSDWCDDIVLSQVGLKASQMRDGYSLNEWNYAFPTRLTGSSSIHIGGGSVEGKSMFNFSRDDIPQIQWSWPKEFKRKHAWNMCYFTVKVYNKYHIYRKWITAHIFLHTLGKNCMYGQHRCTALPALKGSLEANIHSTVDGATSVMKEPAWNNWCKETIGAKRSILFLY